MKYIVKCITLTTFLTPSSFLPLKAGEGNLQTKFQQAGRGVYFYNKTLK